MKLTKHQRKILVALNALCSGVVMPDDWRCNREEWEWFTRREIAKVFSGDQEAWTPPQLRTMLRLREAGLVEPESDVVLKLIRLEVCLCKCDRWKVTDAGKALAESWKVFIPEANTEKR